MVSPLTFYFSIGSEIDVLGKVSTPCFSKLLPVVSDNIFFVILYNSFKILPIGRLRFGAHLQPELSIDLISG